MTATPDLVEAPAGQGASGGRRELLPVHVPLFVAALVLNMFSGHAADLGLPLALDRLCFAAGAFVLLVRRSSREDGRLQWQWVQLPMLGLLGLALWSASVHGTLTTEPGAFAILDRLLVPFSLFVLAPVVFSTPTRRLLLLRAFVLMGVYLGATAVLEIVGPEQLVFPSYITDPLTGNHFGRARGPFTESVALGVVLAFCGFAALEGVLAWRGRWRAVAAASAALSGLGAFLTLTRSVWLGVCVGLLVAAATDGRLRRMLPTVLVTAAATVVVALLLVPGLSSRVDSRSVSDLPVYDRLNTDAAALRALHDHPLTGLGWQRFVIVGPDVVRQADGYPLTKSALDVHNVFLGRAAELGWPGLALFLGAVALGPGAAVVRRSRVPEAQQWRLVLVGGGAAWLSAAMLAPLAQPLPNQLLWLVGGVATAAGLAGRARPSTAEVMAPVPLRPPV